MNPEVFQQTLAEHGIQLSGRQMRQFADYYELLVKTNEQFNLTTITDQADVYLKHFYDSITPAFYAQSIQTQSLSLCDVGAGAGFPSIPLKIVFPQLKITIVDSLNKRINFLNDLAAKLELDDVHFFHDRAEIFGSFRSDHREKYDLVTARAVARLAVLSEFCLPLTKVGGQMVALKAANATEEQSSAAKAVQILGGQIATDNEFQLPVSGDDRHVIIIDKVRKTPKKYPRKPGTPAKQPLSGE